LRISLSEITSLSEELRFTGQAVSGFGQVVAHLPHPCGRNNRLAECDIFRQTRRHQEYTQGDGGNYGGDAKNSAESPKRLEHGGKHAVW